VYYRSLSEAVLRGGVRAERKDRRHRVAYGQSGNLLATGVEERTAANHEPACMQFGKVGKDCIEVPIGARVQDVELRSWLAAACSSLVSVTTLDLVGLTSTAMTVAVGHQLLQQLKPLRSDLHSQIGDTGEIASGPFDTAVCVMAAQR
jgi:hypothetical protein